MPHQSTFPRGSTNISWITSEDRKAIRSIIFFSRYIRNMMMFTFVLQSHYLRRSFTKRTEEFRVVIIQHRSLIHVSKLNPAHLKPQRNYTRKCYSPVTIVYNKFTNEPYSYDDNNRKISLHCPPIQLDIDRRQERCRISFK